MSVSIPQNDAHETVHLLEAVHLELPFWQYFEAFRKERHSFLLDSARDPQTLGKFSFMGGDPEFIYEAKRIPGAAPSDGANVRQTRFRTSAGARLSSPISEDRVADVFEDLQRVLAGRTVPSDKLGELPIPLIAGGVGYFGYECGYFLERLPDRGADDLGMPEVCLMFVDGLLAHDHVHGKSYISALGRGTSIGEAREAAERVRASLRARIDAVDRTPPRPWLGPATPPAKLTIHAHADEAAYIRIVEQAKEQIFAGNCFEVCTCHRLEANFAGDPWDLYRELRRINPAPFASYLNLPHAQIVSSSPERFVSLSRDRIVESRPIKGTRPRGKSPEEDAQLRHDLATSAKDHAENVMIVDLVRNDLGRVCELDSVHVPALASVEEYATVFQLVSTVRGRLEKGLTAMDVVKATIPGGSMTGAPKIEALKIIDSLEPFKRGIYAGGIGYIDVTGAMDLNIVIRTIIVQGGRCYFSVGGAIVSDSDPAAEYAETVDKARALIRALEGVSQGYKHDDADHRQL